MLPGLNFFLNSWHEQYFHSQCLNACGDCLLTNVSMPWPIVRISSSVCSRKDWNSNGGSNEKSRYVAFPVLLVLVDTDEPAVEVSSGWDVRYVRRRELISKMLLHLDWLLWAFAIAKRCRSNHGMPYLYFSMCGCSYFFPICWIIFHKTRPEEHKKTYVSDNKASLRKTVTMSHSRWIGLCIMHSL